MQNTTKTGLLLLIVGTSLGVVENVLLFLTEGLFDLSFAGLIILIGIILIVAGRKEFGERHRKFVIIAIILFIITLVVTVIFVIYLLASVFSAINASSIESLGTIDLSFMKNLFLIAPIGALLGGMVNILLVYELENKNGKIVLFIAFLVTIIISFYTLYSGMAIAEEWASNTQGLINNPSYLSVSQLEDLTENFKQEISRIGAFGIIGNLLFLVAFIIPYNRIKSGDLVPTSALPIYLKRCMNCGRPVPADSIICAYCGKPFN